MSIAAAKPVATSFVKMKPVAPSSITSRITLVTKGAKITSSVALTSVIHTGARKVIPYLLQEPPRDAVSLSRICGQPAIIAEVTFAQPTREKTILPGDERAWIERGGSEIDEFAINEVTDFDGSDRRLRDIGDNANANSLLFAPIIVNEDRAAVAIDLARSIAHAHTNRETFVAYIGAPIGLSADPATPAPVDAAEDVCS
jgi:hypothetical protein